MDKLQTIAKEIAELRTILNAECSPIEELSERVREVVSDPSRNGLSTIFVFSETGFSKPTATQIDLNTGLIKDLDSEWTQTGVDVYSNAIWISCAIFDAQGNILIDWTTPMNIKGAQGVAGPSGSDGEKGDKGDAGDVGPAYRTAMIYTTTDTTDSPMKPYGGRWDSVNNEILDVKSRDTFTWFSNSDQVEKRKYRWVSEGTFERGGGLVGDWSAPFRLTGDSGEDGKDGVSSEFIYRLLPNIKIYELLKSHLEIQPLENGNTDEVPTTNDSLAASLWTDSPSGITKEWPIEVVCSRKWDHASQKWEPWSNCIIWAKWGEDGTDGDGVEYIYLITPKKNGDIEIDSEYVSQHYMPDLSLLLNHPKYQENEFCINSDFTTDEFNLNDYKWTDEPSDVGPEEPVEWVSIRKRTTPEGSNEAVWGEFSTPKVWATYSKDGKDGADGKEGRPGKTIYPAGIYDPFMTYTSTDTTVPYVIYENEYYQLNVSSWIGDSQIYKNPKDDIEAGNTNWIKFDKFEAVFAKVGMIDNGTFGAAVFSGNYMFSQYGVDSNGNATKNYQYFDQNDPFGDNKNFYPNVCIDYYNGYMWIQKNKFVVKDNQVLIGPFALSQDGMEYDFEVNGQEYKMQVGKNGVGLFNITDIYWPFQLGTNGDCTFAGNGVTFKRDGSGNLANVVAWNPDGSGHISNILEWDNRGIIVNDGSKKYITYGQTINEDVTPEVPLFGTTFIEWAPKTTENPDDDATLHIPDIEKTPQLKQGFLFTLKIYNPGTDPVRFDVEDSKSWTKVTIPGFGVKTIHYCYSEWGNGTYIALFE